MISEDYNDYYSYKVYDPNDDKYKESIAREPIGDFQSKIQSGHIVAIEVEEIPETIFKFNNPNSKFLIEKKLQGLIEQLNNEFLGGNYYKFIVYLICNLQKQYLDNLQEQSSYGLENDFKTLAPKKKKLISGLENFIARHKQNDTSAPQVTGLKISFSDGKNINIDNFLIINDILSSYLEKYDFKPGDSNSIWKSEIDKTLIGFDVEKLKRDTKIKFSTSLYKYLNKESIIENEGNSIKNSGLRIINTIFSLASIPINKENTAFDFNTTNLVSYYTKTQMDVLNKWISRY